MATCALECNTPRTCTPENADLAITGDKQEVSTIYVADLAINLVTKEVDFSNSVPILPQTEDNPQLRENMQQLLDMILGFFETEVQKVESGELKEEDQRECECLFEKYRTKWAPTLKAKIAEIIKLTKREKISDVKIRKLELDLDVLLKRPSGSLHHKAAVFKERLKKYKTSLTTCLRNRMVPPTNNWSEHALRSTKVKLRVSSQFRTMEGAQDYAILRSIIDSAILQGKHPFDALTNPQILLI